MKNKNEIIESALPGKVGFLIAIFKADTAAGKKYFNQYSNEGVKPGGGRKE